MQIRSQQVRSQRLAVTVLAGAAFLSGLDLFVVNVAFDDIAQAVGAGTPGGPRVADVSWILTAYAVVFAAFLVPLGRVADKWGHKPVFLAGVAVFTAASLACAATGDLWFLVAARARAGDRRRCDDADQPEPAAGGAARGGAGPRGAHLGVGRRDRGRGRSLRRWPAHPGGLATGLRDQPAGGAARPRAGRDEGARHSARALGRPCPTSSRRGSSPSGSAPWPSPWSGRRSGAGPPARVLGLLRGRGRPRRRGGRTLAAAPGAAGQPRAAAGADLPLVGRQHPRLQRRLRRQPAGRRALAAAGLGLVAPAHRAGDRARAGARAGHGVADPPLRAAPVRADRDRGRLAADGLRGRAPHARAWGSRSTT